MSAPDQQPAPSSGFGAWMGSMWLYTALRFALFGALWGILYLIGLPVFGAALLGLILSVPLSFVLLARPRARFANQIEQRMSARRVDHGDLAERLDPDADDDEIGVDATEKAKAALAAQRRRKHR